MRTWMLSFAMVLAVPQLDAATRFVAAGGSNSGDCSSAPCATIPYAIAQATAGDVIAVGAGTFGAADEAIVIDKTLVLHGERFGVDARGRGGAETVLAAPLHLQAPGIVVDGFTITCAACRPCPICPAGAAIEHRPPFGLFQASNNVIRGNWLGVRFRGTPGEQSSLRFNDFIDNDGPSHSIAVYLVAGTNASVAIEQNRFRGSVGPHIEVSTWSSPGAGLKIANNEFDLDRVDDGQAVWMSDVRGAEIADNRVTGGVQAAIELLDRVHDVAVLRNVVTGNAKEALRIGGDVSFPIESNGVVRIEGNTFVENARGIHVGPQPQATPEVHFNRIARNGVDVFTSGANAVDAENNWWGCNEVSCATTSLAPGSSVDLAPWLLMTIEASDTRIAWNETSTVTLRFDRNSDGETVAGFPATDVAFVAIRGVVTPPVVRTSGGVASTVFRPTAAGLGTVSASLDEQGVAVNLELPVTEPRRRAVRH